MVKPSLYSAPAKSLRAILFIALLLTNLIAHAAASQEIQPGQALPPILLDGLNTESRKFSSYQGKPLLINVWASWCGPCRKEMPSLQRLAKKFNGKSFSVIGISIDDYRNRARKFLKRTGTTFDNFIDHNLVMEKHLGARTIPFTVFVNAEGQIIDKVSGAFQWDSDIAIHAIKDVFDLPQKTD